MKLNISNLGPIKSGTISCNHKLMVLTGPNNTGKSYLTYLIHGISKYNELTDLFQLRDIITTLVLEHLSIAKHLETNEKIDLRELMSKIIPGIFKSFTKIIQGNLSKIFASSLENVQINASLDSFIFNEGNDYLRYISIEDGVLSIITNDGRVQKNPMPSAYKDAKEYLITSLFVYIQVCINELVNTRTFFFPAERTAINLFAKHITATKAEIKDELDTEVIAGMTDAELGRRLRNQVKTGPKYPYAIREYINFVNNFKLSNKAGRFSRLADSIEKILANGKIHLNEFDQVTFTPSGSKKALELHLASSLIKSLSYLILYLRYTAELGDQIIIDEPELNLHPNLQIGIAKVIAELVNAGFKVIISTHSDYLLKELNNLILLSKLPKSDETNTFLKKNGYQQHHILNGDYVGAYFLNKNNIESIDVNKDGLEVPSINDAITLIDSVAQEIFFRLDE